MVKPLEFEDDKINAVDAQDYELNQQIREEEKKLRLLERSIARKSKKVGKSNSIQPT